MHYLGWQARIVHERKVAQKSYFAIFSSWEYDLGPSQAPVILKQNEIPWLRRWLGDKPVYAIVLTKLTTDDQVERIKCLFPEATLIDDRHSN